MSSDAIVFAGLMPHAPILVPGVGGEHVGHVRATVAAMQQLAAELIARRPDSLLVISPHSPRRPGAFGLWSTARLRGSFEQFGLDDDCIDLPPDPVLVEHIAQQAAARGLRTWRIGHGVLDHGAMVPLAFLRDAGWQGPTAVLSLNESGDGGLDPLGEAIAAAAQAPPRRLAMIASGDMSHRLTLGAPCGFHPDGARFDEAFLVSLRNGAADALGRIEPELIEHAAEDVVDPTRVALAATAFATERRQILSYEGPFGVGYGVAILSAREPAPLCAAPVRAQDDLALARLADLPRVARAAVEARFAGAPQHPPFTGTGELTEPHGVFVTVRMNHGELRGCRGSVLPNDVVRQTWHHAQSAAFDDPRFDPLRADELPAVRFIVSVLGEVAPVESPAELEPARFGVLVTAPDGRSALLLPGIAGIVTVADQLRCVKDKAGIRLDEWVRIERFTSRVFQEA